MKTYKKHHKRIKHTTQTLASILLLTLFIYSCNKDDDTTNNQFTLPPITQTGANTFGCYIDTQLFIPRNGSGTFNNSDRALILRSGQPNITDYYEIDARDYKSEKTSNILLHMDAVHDNGVGEYVINESNGLRGIDGLNHTYMHCRVWRDNVGSYQNYLSYESSGIITVTNYNFNSGIISGTFSGSVRNYQTPHDTIQITQGRFDIDVNTLPDIIFP